MVTVSNLVHLIQCEADYLPIENSDVLQSGVFNG